MSGTLTYRYLGDDAPRVGDFLGCDFAGHPYRVAAVEHVEPMEAERRAYEAALRVRELTIPAFRPDWPVPDPRQTRVTVEPWPIPGPEATLVERQLFRLAKRAALVVSSGGTVTDWAAGRRHIEAAA